MPAKHKQLYEGLSFEESLLLLDAARRALGDADLFDELVYIHQIAPATATVLLEKIQDVMDSRPYYIGFGYGGENE